MLEINNEVITLIDKNKQRMVFLTDGNGDYYFTIYADYEARPGDTYNFLIDENHVAYSSFKKLIEEENHYANAKNTITPYFIIKNNSVRIADQNHPIMEAESLEIVAYQNKIRLLFSNKFPMSVRVVGVGRLDHHPFFLPIIDLFDNLKLLEINNLIIETGLYQNVKKNGVISKKI